jgi:hypothetical protein
MSVGFSRTDWPIWETSRTVAAALFWSQTTRLAAPAIMPSSSNTRASPAAGSCECMAMEATVSWPVWMIFSRSERLPSRALPPAPSSMNITQPSAQLSLLQLCWSLEGQTDIGRRRLIALLRAPSTMTMAPASPAARWPVLTELSTLGSAKAAMMAKVAMTIISSISDMPFWRAWYCVLPAVLFTVYTHVDDLDIA